VHPAGHFSIRRREEFPKISIPPPRPKSFAAHANVRPKLDRPV
jgi:hypothetical protein